MIFKVPFLRLTINRYQIIIVFDFFLGLALVAVGYMDPRKLDCSVVSGGGLQRYSLLCHLNFIFNRYVEIYNKWLKLGFVLKWTWPKRRPTTRPN